MGNRELLRGVETEERRIKKIPKVLIACEYSGIVRTAFEKRGWEAWSCDLLMTEIPGNHYQGDVRNILSEDWDLLIAHPPCTHLSSSGAAWFLEKIKDGRQKKAIEFFFLFLRSPIKRIAIENPVGIISTYFRKPNQIIQPWQFGDPFQKSTCLWLKNLPKLKPTLIVNKGEFIITKSGRKMPKWYAEAYSLPAEQRSKVRSKTFNGIAEAMADQWSNLKSSPTQMHGLISKKPIF